jgi:uncharacterized protein with PQ loop repeat
MLTKSLQVKGFNMHAIGEVFGFIAGFIGIATGLPQVLRIRRLGHAEGLALSPWLLMLFQFAAWTAFGLKVASPSILFANFFTFFTTALVVVAIIGSTFRNWSIVVLGGLVAGAIVFYAPEELVNWVLILLTGARLPQLVRSWFNRKSSKPSAVSVQSLLVALTSVTCWLVFAVLTENTLVTATTIIALSITLATAVLERNIAKHAAAAEAFATA